MWKLRCVLVYLLAASLCVEVVARNRKEKSRKKEINKKEQSLCAIEDNSPPLLCSCKSGSLSNHSVLECWVFTGVTKDHTIWSLFEAQQHISELKLLKRPTEQFTFVPTKAIKYLRNLKTLEIIYATINEIHPYAFANLTNLKELKLSRNQIVTLEPKAFAHMPNLTELDLEENRIAELRRDVFFDLPSLQKLYAAKNNLSVIEEGSFRHLSHLVELELDFNYINVLTRDTFTGLSELQRLDLSNNLISMLGDLTFSELWILEDLNLEHNMIEFISDRAFAGLTHLRKLGLSHNKLKKLSSGLLGGVSTIYHLDLRSNDLETLTYDSVKPILHNLVNDSSYFYLTDNKFICDCRLEWMHSLRNETKNERVRNTLDEIVCSLRQPDEEDPKVTASSLATDLKTIGNKNTNHQFSDDDNYDYPDDYGDTNYAEQKDSFNNYPTDFSVAHDPRMRHLFEIPLKELPCPQRERPTESPSTYLRTPGYSGVNTNGCNNRILGALSLLFTPLLISLT